MEHSLENRGDGDELIDTKVIYRFVFYGQPTMALQSTPLVYDFGISMLIIH